MNRPSTLSAAGAAAGLLSVAASVLLAASAATQEPPDRDWYYCQLAERPYGRTVYVSDVFTTPAGASEAEVESAFEDHVQRRYVREPVAGGLCLGPKTSRGEAREDRRDTITSLRRDGVTVVRTNWRFRGTREREQ